jgi:hypothetical protein
MFINILVLLLKVNYLPAVISFYCRKIKIRNAYCVVIVVTDYHIWSTPRLYKKHAIQIIIESALAQPAVTLQQRIKFVGEL